MAKNWIAFILIGLIIYTGTGIADQTDTLPYDSTKITPVTSEPLVYTIAYLNLSLTSVNWWASCASPGEANGQPAGKGLGYWKEFYVQCPANSLQMPSFGFDPANTYYSLYTVACERKSGSTTNSSITMQPENNPGLGMQIGPMTCFVPVEVWIPLSTLNNKGPATLYGQSVYISYWGTMPLIQPDINTPQFTATITIYNSSDTINGYSWGGTYANVLKNVIPANAFQYISTPSFYGCGWSYSGGTYTAGSGSGC